MGSVHGDDTTSVVPLPRRSVNGTGVFVLDPGFHVRVVGHRDPRLDDAIDRFMARLGKLTGIHRFSNEDGATLEVWCERDGETPESYILDVSEHGARLEADTVVGVLRGLETMLQLVRMSEQGFAVPAVRIDDEPRFPWRGLLIDVSRHFQPLDVIKRNLDAMAAVKLNVLHWHLTDDQGFRIESQRFPNCIYWARRASTTPGTRFVKSSPTLTHAGSVSCPNSTFPGTRPVGSSAFPSSARLRVPTTSRPCTAFEIRRSTPRVTKSIDFSTFFSARWPAFSRPLRPHRW